MMRSREGSADGSRGEYSGGTSYTRLVLDLSGYPTSRELARNRRVGQRERGPHDSFSLVSPYSSVSKPRVIGDFVFAFLSASL